MPWHKAMKFIGFLAGITTTNEPLRAFTTLVHLGELPIVLRCPLPGIWACPQANGLALSGYWSNTVPWANRATMSSAV